MASDTELLGDSPPSRLLGLDSNVATLCLEYVTHADLCALEMVSRGIRRHVAAANLWRRAFMRNVHSSGWRLPPVEPASWKRYISLYEQDVRVRVARKPAYGCCTVFWRVPLPIPADALKVRSRVFDFAEDALGDPIMWQMEFDLGSPVPLPSHASAGGDATCQPGTLRVWTTNLWTPRSAQHYYGAYCTVSVRDSLNATDLVSETRVDIDSSEPFAFTTHAAMSELLVKMDLTLALEMPLPLNPYFDLLSPACPESDVVKIGYCKAVLEIARCKRKVGCNFVKRGDCNVESLVYLAGAPDTSDALRMEVFQALFNLLGPSALMLPDALVVQLLQSCAAQVHRTIHRTPGDGAGGGAAQDMVQNVLGNMFNLLAHPQCHTVLASQDVVHDVSHLLFSPDFETSKFSVIMIMLTMRTWGHLNSRARVAIVTGVASFMANKDPLDSEATGIAWDETDVASFFLPLLRSQDLVCISFVSWCLGLHYFGRAPAVQG